MTDAPDSTRAGDEPIGPGIALRRARETRGLTIEDVARSLHLDSWMIESLEDDDFEALGAPVFAKGHLRQYGALLGLASDDLMIAYYRVRGRHDAPPPPITATMARPKEGRGLFYAGIALAVIVVLALAALLWFVAGRAPVSVAPDRPAVRPAAAGRLDGAVAPIAAPPVGDPVPTSSAPATVSDADPAPASAGPANTGPAPAAGQDPESISDLSLTEPEALAAEPAPPTVASGMLELKLAFASESWVEVYDADRQRLLYTMVGAGRERTVAGRAPLEVYLGRSGDVALEVNGQPFTIPPGSIRGNTARFAIGAD